MLRCRPSMAAPHVRTCGREKAGRRPQPGFSEGKVFEKAGVNVSVVHGTLRPEAARAMGGGQALDDDEDWTSSPRA